MEEIINRLFQKRNKPISLEDIFIATQADTKEKRKEVEEILQEKNEKHELYQTEDGYISMYKTTKRVGIYHANGQDKKVVVDNKQYPILLDKTNHTIDKDKVLVDIPAFSLIGPHLTEEQKELKKHRVAIIEEIVDRDLDYIIGTIYQENNQYFIMPNKEEYKGLKILLDGNDYEAGQKVFVKLKSDKESINTNTYHTSLIEPIDLQDKIDDIALEAYKFGIYKTFTEETREQIKNIPDIVREEDKIGKADLTDWEIFTIDGDNTKDIDDAISLYIDEFGHSVLGVHIAYPAYYIEKGSPLYKEALSKGTSCYPTNGRVFPMLPPKLSNGICSLNPNVERLAISYIITFDEDANVIDYKIMESVIKSNIQMTYKKVEDLISKGIVHEGYEEHKDTLLMMQTLAKKLEDKRKERGALMLNSKEIKITTDETGKTSTIEERQRREAEKIIESFMVVSAECYAQFCEENNIPCIYRNHDIPLQENINRFIREIKLYGIDYPDEVDVHDYNSIQKLSEYIMEHDIQGQILMSMFIRNLKKANFGIENIGHCGLASPGHVPNTSPMRRGNDFIDQYVLKEMYLSTISSTKVKSEIERDIPELNISKITNLQVSEEMIKQADKPLTLVRKNWTKTLSLLTSHLTTQEIKASKCERSVCHMKMVEKMTTEVGNDCIGTIIELNNRNITVMLENSAEVTIPLSSLPEEDCIYDKKLGYIKTENNSYFFGDKVVVTIEAANPNERKVYCHLLEKIEENEACKKMIKKYEQK